MSIIIASKALSKEIMLTSQIKTTDSKCLYQLYAFKMKDIINFQTEYFIMVKIRNCIFLGLILNKTPVTQIFLYVCGSDCFLFSLFMREMVTKTKHSFFILFMEMANADLRNVIHITEFQVESRLPDQIPAFLQL